MAKAKAPEPENNDTFEVKPGETVYAVKIGEEIISVSANSAAEAERKAKEQAA